MAVAIRTTDLPDSGRYQGFEVFQEKANMIKRTLTIACAIVALTFSANANAQSCGGGCGGYGGGYAMGSAMSFGGCGDYGSYGAVGTVGLNECGRDYTNQQAASLWGGYCTETCSTGRRQRTGLFSKCGNRGGGCGGHGFGGGNMGCFGYPTGGCGCGGGCGGGCGAGGGLFSGFSLFSKLKSRGNGCGGGCGAGGGLFSKLKSGGGCNLFSKLKGRKQTQYAAIVSYPVTTVAVDQCGCGNSGQYFNYAVGAEYGNAGMQSNVSGMLTGQCCGGGASVLDGSMGASTFVEQGVAAPIQ